MVTQCAGRLTHHRARQETDQHAQHRPPHRVEAVGQPEQPLAPAAQTAISGEQHIQTRATASPRLPRSALV